MIYIFKIHKAVITNETVPDLEYMGIQLVFIQLVFVGEEKRA